MGCVTSIPERALVCFGRKELTPLSADVFISIPKRVYKRALYRVLTQLTYQVSVGSDIFDWLNNSKLNGLTVAMDLVMFGPSG
jgi:hypothetical protein